MDVWVTNVVELTNSMEQSTSWEANSHSASQEIPHLLWNLKVHCYVHKGLQLTPSHPVSLRSILVLPSHLYVLVFQVVSPH